MSVEIRFNRRVPGELRGILSYYEEASGPELADAFYDDLMAHIDEVYENPTRFHFYEGDLRRANLDRFPYHFLYRVTPNCVRVLVLRHHHRDPRYGTRRK